MNKRFFKRFLILAIIGTLLHFTYEWSHYNKIVALFSAVNESTWEHIKIGFTPLFILYLYDYFKNKEYSIQNIALSLISFMFLIIGGFYSYKLIFKSSSLIFDIILFYLSLFISLIIYENKKYRNHKSLYYIITILIIIMYFLSSFFPPKIFLFKDPRGFYGLCDIYSSK